MDYSLSGSSVLEFSRLEYWNGLPFSLRGNETNFRSRKVLPDLLCLSKLAEFPWGNLWQRLVSNADGIGAALGRQNRVRF